LLPNFRYKAFISYSWADAKWGKWLHHAIETYRTPRPLVGTEGRRGPVPARLHPLFKDREEEAAGASIGHAVEEALANSEFLIVICSPNSAKSQWVNREIAWFKTHRNPANILALIVGGEPGASALPGREADECFPRALTNVVDAAMEVTPEALDAPLAADARDSGDGKRGARLKIAAALLGVGLDELVRRDDRRRARLRIAATAASLAIAAVMSVLAWSATVARNEAVFQRNEAQDLTEFMLTDLRGRLDEVGRLDILETVGSRLMTSYDRQDLAALDADALGRRARVQLLLGEIENNRGNLAGALKTYQAAAATTAELLAREPDVPQRQFDHAQSLYWVGFIAWQRGDLGTAKRQFQGYDALASKLVAADPRKFDWQLEKSYAQSNLGTVASESGDLAAASRHFAAALVIDRRFYEANRTLDDAIMQYSETLSWAARVAARRYEFEEAAALYGQGVALYRQALAADPKNQALLTKLTIITTQHARALNDLGRTEEARPAADEAIALATTMSARDRSNAQAAEYMRNAQLLAAQLAKDRRDFDTATRLANDLLQAIDAQRRSETETNNATLEQANLARLVLAAVALNRQNKAEAAQHYAMVHAAVAKRDLRAAGSANIIAFVSALGGLGQIAPNAGHWQKLLTALQQAGGAPPAVTATVQARALIAANRADEGWALVRRLQQAGYAHPDFVAAFPLARDPQNSGAPSPRAR
jgi:tetratricopeptide (TPR) repeat protein